MNTIKFNFLTLAVLLLMIYSCSDGKKEEDNTDHMQKEELPWHKNASIYELNIRQFSPEGSFKAIIPHLERIRDMGTEIIWLMPVYPIGIKDKKGGLGSYYAITDYKEVNPEFGTREDFRALIDAAHDLGMKVILDWVANHTAWDHIWVEQHPDWYTADEEGNSPIVPRDNDGKPTDWTDVAELDFENQAMRDEMIDCMLFWVKEFDIDGYRCDVAGFVPTDFWERTRDSLNAVKKVFMLAEWEDEELHKKAFDATYGWEFHHLLNHIAQDKATIFSVIDYMNEELKRFPPSAYRMNFITNHDENSWNGTVEERMGESADNMAVLAYTLYGIPLVYSGQEAPLKKRLAFFDKDEIEWNGYQKQDFISRLLHLKKENEALWNGEYGSQPVFIDLENENILIYHRGKNKNAVLVLINQTAEEQNISFPNPSPDFDWSEYNSKEQVIAERSDFETMIPAKSHKIFVQYKNID